MDRLLFARSCRAVKKALFTAPHLWAVVHCEVDEDPEHSYHGLDRVLRLAYRVLKLARGSRLLTVSITIPPSALAFSGVEDFIALHLRHTQVLRCNISTNTYRPRRTAVEYDRAFNTLAAGVLCENAPQLQALELSSRRWDRSAAGVHRLPTSLLGRTPGRLRELSLLSIAMSRPADYPALSRLEVLFLHMDNLSLPESQVLNFIQDLPMLTRLGLNFLEYVPATPPAAPIVPRNLRMVGLFRFKKGACDILQLFKQVDHVSVRLDAAVEVLEPVFNILKFRSNDFRARVTKCEFHVEGSGFELFVPRGKSSFASFNAASRPVTPPEYANCIVSLTMHELQWEHLVQGGLFLARLTRLRILLASCFHNRKHSVLHWAHPLPLFIDWDPDRNSRQSMFPAIERLELLSTAPPTRILRSDERRECQELDRTFRGMMTSPRPSPCTCLIGCVLSLDDVADFIRRTIPAGNRLQTLVLAAVDEIVGPEPGIALCNLMSLVQTLDIQPSVSHELREWSTHSLMLDGWGIPSSSLETDENVFRGSRLTPDTYSRRWKAKGRRAARG